MSPRILPGQSRARTPPLTPHQRRAVSLSHFPKGRWTSCHSLDLIWSLSSTVKSPCFALSSLGGGETFIFLFGHLPAHPLCLLFHGGVTFPWWSVWVFHILETSDLCFWTPRHCSQLPLVSSEGISAPPPWLSERLSSPANTTHAFLHYVFRFFSDIWILMLLDFFFSIRNEVEIQLYLFQMVTHLYQYHLLNNPSFPQFFMPFLLAAKHSYIYGSISGFSFLFHGCICSYFEYFCQVQLSFFVKKFN